MAMRGRDLTGNMEKEGLLAGDVSAKSVILEKQKVSVTNSEMAKEIDNMGQFRSSRDMIKKFKIKQEMVEENNKRKRKPQDNKGLPMKTNNNSTFQAPIQNKNLSNAEKQSTGKAPTLKNIVINPQLIPNMVNKGANLGQGLKRQLFSHGETLNIKNLGKGQYQLPKTQRNVDAKKSAIQCQSSQSQMPQTKTASATQTQGNFISKNSTSQGQSSQSQIPKTTTNTHTKENVILDKSTFQGREELDNPNKKIKTKPVCPSMSVEEYCEMMGVEEEVEEEEQRGEQEEEEEERGEQEEEEQRGEEEEEERGEQEEEERGEQEPDEVMEQASEGPVKRKGRGKTKCKDIHGRSIEDRKEIQFDNYGEPCGPTEAHVTELSTFLGSVARNARFCPATYTNWKAVPNKDSIWNYVNKKFIIPENGRKVVFNIINDAWRKHKHHIKKKYFEPFKSNKDRLKKPPKFIPLEHFKMMINYWKCEKIQKMCKQNATNNSKRKWKHRKGKIRFSLIKARLRAKNENNQEPSQSDIFIETRTKDGIPLDDETGQTIETLKDEVGKNGKSPDEAFRDVMGPEKPGRVRCAGRTATPTLMKKNKEMADMGEKHALEIAVLKEEMEMKQTEMEKKFERKMEERDRQMEERESRMKSLMKAFLSQANPGIDMDAIEAMMTPLTPRDANSGHLSSTAMHNPENEENDEILRNDDDDDYEGDEDMG